MKDINNSDFQLSNESDLLHRRQDKSNPITQNLINKDHMLLFLTLTQRCQLNCLYCGNGTNRDIEDSIPHTPELTYDINLLKKFQNVKKLILCFYGGEPLLRINLIEDIMPILPNAIYVLQTNGLFLNMLKPAIIRKFDCILVSIDGDEITTDHNRGKGTYKKVIKNCKFIREIFKGDLIARMTVSGINNIYESVNHLLSLNIFDHVHWQLDVEWDSDMNSRYPGGYIHWRDNIYNPGITKLYNQFVDNLKIGKVMGIVPFLGLLKYFINGEKIKRILCGSGSDSFNITTTGFVNCCPIAAEFDPIDDIRKEGFNHKDLYDTEFIGGICKNCEILEKCGGRCLYANKHGWWGPDEHKEVCQTIFHLVNTLESRLDEIKALIKDNKELSDLVYYPKYNNTCEIIP